MSWDDARGVCVQWGGDLASVTNDAEMRVIQKISKNSRDSFWIGSNDKLAEGKFAWSDGTDYKYTNWSKHEPNNWGSGEDCTEVWRGGFEWNDLACGNARKFMCKRAVGAKPIPAPKARDVTLKFMDQKLSWFDARGVCQSWGGELASVLNEAESKLISNLAKDTTDLVWIGASDHNKEKTWTWADGSKWAFSNWAPNEPNNFRGNQDCGGPWHNGKDWDDQNCNSQKAFICQRGRDAVPVMSKEEEAFCIEDNNNRGWFLAKTEKTANWGKGDTCLTK